MRVVFFDPNWGQPKFAMLWVQVLYKSCHGALANSVVSVAKLGLGIVDNIQAIWTQMKWSRVREGILALMSL